MKLVLFFPFTLGSDVKKAAVGSCLIRNTSPPKSFQFNHSNDLYQVFLHSVWIQDVLDRATRISHRPREVRKMAGKGTNHNLQIAR